MSAGGAVGRKRNAGGGCGCVLVAIAGVVALYALAPGPGAPPPEPDPGVDPARVEAFHRWLHTRIDQRGWLALRPAGGSARSYVPDVGSLRGERAAIVADACLTRFENGPWWDARGRIDFSVTGAGECSQDPGPKAVSALGRSTPPCAYGAKAAPKGALAEVVRQGGTPDRPAPEPFFRLAGGGVDLGLEIMDEGLPGRRRSPAHERALAGVFLAHWHLGDPPAPSRRGSP